MARFIRQKGDSTVYEVRPDQTLIGVSSPEQLAQLGGSFADVSEVDALPSTPKATDYLSEVRQAYAPEMDNLNLRDEIARRSRESSKITYGINKDELKSSYDDAAFNTQRTQQENENSFMNKQSQLGLLRSGMTGTGLSTMAEDTQRSINRLNIQKANRLADLTLSDQNAEASLADVLRQTGNRRTVIESDITGKTKSLADAQLDAEFNRLLSMQALANETEVGTTIDLGQFGKVTGRKAAPQRVTSAEDYAAALGQYLNTQQSQSNQQGVGNQAPAANKAAQSKEDALNRIKADFATNFAAFPDLRRDTETKLQDSINGLEQEFSGTGVTKDDIMKIMYEARRQYDGGAVNEQTELGQLQMDLKRQLSGNPLDIYSKFSPTLALQRGMTSLFQGTAFK
jgi:hypothetical protein